jgi:hypothetical protein
MNVRPNWRQTQRNDAQIPNTLVIPSCPAPPHLCAKTIKHDQYPQKENDMKTLENILVSRGELDSIYDGQSGLNLWRAMHKDSTGKNPLLPDFYPRMVRGSLRRPDIVIKEIGGVEYVEAEVAKGTSLFNKAGAFGFKNFDYFEIPSGTEIPVGLIIIKGEFNKKYGATHYSICPNFRMRKDLFVSLLDRLAINAQFQKRKRKNG